MSAHLSIEVRGMVGDDIKDVLSDMIKLANQFNTSVTTNFNGIRLYMAYMPIADQVLRIRHTAEQYYEAQKTGGLVVSG